MNIGDKILKYRKLKGYSQEDIANSLNVSRQTVSKWETNQSSPDFNKIIPLCKLFGITADELLDLSDLEIKSNNENNDLEVKESDENIGNKKYAFFTCVSVFLYFVAVIWIIFGEEIGVNENINVSIFLGIIAIATTIIIYNSMVNDKKVKQQKLEKKSNKKVKMINDILAMLVFIIYMIVSFITGAWNITWILWIIYACITEIVKSVFELGE